MTLERLKQILLVILLAVLSGIAIAFIPMALRAVREAAAVARETKQLLAEYRSTGTEMKIFLKDLRESFADGYYDIKASNQTSAAILRSTYELVRKADVSLFGGKDDGGILRPGLMNEAQGLVGDIRISLRQMTEDLHNLFGKAGDTAEELDIALARAGALMETLEDELKTGSPKVQATLVAATRAMDDVSKLLEDPNTAKILADTEKLTYHAAETTQTVDIVLRPYRQKAKLMKVVLDRLLGIATGVVKYNIGGR